MVAEMEELIRQRKAPRGARAPPVIQREGLFQLDVDDPIWEDVDCDDDGDVPLWLGEEKVRQGIQLMLRVARCNEEGERLKMERSNMQEWFMEEWKCTQAAVKSAGEEWYSYAM